MKETNEKFGIKIGINDNHERQKGLYLWLFLLSLAYTIKYLEIKIICTLIFDEIVIKQARGKTGSKQISMDQIISQLLNVPSVNIQAGNGARSSFQGGQIAKVKTQMGSCAISGATVRDLKWEINKNTLSSNIMMIMIKTAKENKHEVQASNEDISHISVGLASRWFVNEHEEKDDGDGTILHQHCIIFI